MERAEQVASGNAAATTRPATAITQDTAAGDKVPTGLVLRDVESPHSDTLDAAPVDPAASENECESAAALREADEGSAPAAAHSDTSAEAGVEETSQAIQTVAQ